MWTLFRAGRLAEARERMLMTWSTSMDEVGAGEQGCRVALRLFERVGFCTDDHDGWTRLPAVLVVYRAGQPGRSTATASSRSLACTG
jgi:hypothetical protein